MARPRRHWFTVSVFFITYSIFHAVLSTTVSELQEDLEGFTDVSKGTTPLVPKIMVKDEVEKQRGTENVASPETVSNEMPVEAEKATEGRKMMKSEQEEEEKKIQKDADYEDFQNATMVEPSEKEEEEESAIPTLRPPRTCTPPAIEQFPLPLIRQTARKHGGLIIHVLVAVYTFIGLAIVCDKYFVSSLYRICEEFKLAPDVAGATFMAAGSSAPELATVIIGVFCAQDDIGVSGVIGSAVFNIIFVISVCALCAGTVSHLNWWALCRDCFFYALSILVMLCTIANGYVSWRESLMMLISYGIYCVVLSFNSRLEAWAQSLPFKLRTRKEQAALVTYKSAGGQPPAGTAGDGQYAQVEGQTKETTLNTQYNADAAVLWAPAKARHSPSPDGAAPRAQPPANTAAAAARAKEYNPETANPLLKPVGANAVQLVCWYVAYPVHWACRHTMPDCRGRWYPVTFIVSMLWISFYSYFMVWMITIIGYTLGIPDTVMGLTFVAAGMSVPDALSSLAVIKEGYGDMAVSNAVGSNVFDILVCLGLPWFIQTAIIQPGSYVNVISKGLSYSTISLVSTVIFLVLATHANGWKLDRKFGAVLMVWYLLFIAFASLYELNIFGDFHPPDCLSMF